MIVKNHLYIAHWQVKLKTVSSMAFPSDKRQKRYNPYALDWTISSMKALTYLFLNPQLLAHCQGQSNIVDRQIDG